MRFHWLRARAFVHATEDEEKVKQALLWLVAQDEVREAYSKIVRQKTKGHYGNEILLLDLSLKKQPDVEADLARILAEDALRSEVADSILRRLDEDLVLHVRLDKQAAVERRLALGEGSDAVVVTAKAVTMKGDVPAQQWARYLADVATLERPARTP